MTYHYYTYEFNQYDDIAMLAEGYIPEEWDMVITDDPDLMRRAREEVFYQNELLEAELEHNFSS